MNRQRRKENFILIHPYQKVHLSKKLIPFGSLSKHKNKGVSRIVQNFLNFKVAFANLFDVSKIFFGYRQLDQWICKN